MGRSTFAGSGKFGATWLGDSLSIYQHMKYSVTSIMLSNIMGLPFVGADICGTIGNATDDPELCARWHVVGAFYPFSRNYNGYGYPGQEPYASAFANQTYEGNTTYLDIMRQAMRTKYCLLMYYYTELTALASSGGTFFRPLFFVFPNDTRAYMDNTNNVMLGDALKLSV